MKKKVTELSIGEHLLYLKILGTLYPKLQYIMTEELTDIFPQGRNIRIYSL